MNLPAKAATGDIMESVLIKGDLAKLTEMERVNYYNAVCKSIGLNPLTRPFDYITLNGKLQFYAKRDACDQLRKIQNISLAVISTETNDEIFTVHVKAKTPEGREDEDFGAVFLPTRITGEIRANLILKAVTKAKRRATLSICGLGFLDELEVEDIPSAAPGRKFLNPSSPQSIESQAIDRLRAENAELRKSQAAQQKGGAAMALKPLAQDLNDEIPDFADAASSVEGAAAVAAAPATGGADLKQTLASSAVLEAALAAVRAGRSVQDVARQLAASHGEPLVQVFFGKLSKGQREELRKIKPELMELYPK